MKAILCEHGLAFNAGDYAAVFGNDRLLQLQRRYTIRTVDRTTKIPQITKMYRMIRGGETSIIELPRFASRELLAPDGGGALSHKAPLAQVACQLPVHAALPKGALEYTGRSNPNQQVVVRHTLARFAAGRKKEGAVGGATLKVMAGVGKTYIAMDVISRMRLKTLVVVPNTYLLDQWASALREHFPNAKIGFLYGKQKCDGDIIVGIINTVADLAQYEVSEKKPLPNVGKTLKHTKVTRTVVMDDLLAQVGLTVMDESHMYVSKEFRKVFRRIHSRFTLGLSATPDCREDKLDRIHQAWLGPIVDADSLDGYNAAQDAFMSDAKIIAYHAPADRCKFKVRKDGMIDYASIVDLIVGDPGRNQIIVEEVLALLGKGHFVFVFSDRRAHLEHLYDRLEGRCAELGEPSVIELPEAGRKVILYGGATEQTIDRAKRESKVILTTYAYSSTGVSIKKMDALVLATPRRSNMKQIINRVFRLGSDQSIRRTIIDIEDAKLPLKRQIQERVKAYQERGSRIVRA